MPKPHAGESQDDFISRCMADPEARRDHPGQKERAGFCYGMWKQHAKDADLKDADLYASYCAEKFIVTGDGIFEGRALTFATEDDNYGYTFAPDAFNDSLETRGVRGIKMLYEHDVQKPVGAWQEIRVQSDGLYVRGKLTLETELGKEVKALMEDGALGALSVGFMIKEIEDKHILKADLLEISIVSFPADQTATIGMDALRHYPANAALPKAVRSVLPPDAQTLYRKAYNQYAASHPDAPTSRAAAVAWQAVRRKFSAPAKEAGMWVQKIKHDGDGGSTCVMADAMMLDGVKRTADGYLTAYAKVARTGIQLYRGFECGRPDLDVVRVYRPPAEVFDREALMSFAHKPITLDHPSEMVSAENWKGLAVGQIGDKVEFGENFVRVPLVLMDAAAIKAVESGKRELSMGYTCDLKWGHGYTPDGEEYDAQQVGIKANHLAVVAKARGGSDLRIGDAGKEDDMPELKTQTIDVDGVEVVVADASASYLKKFLSSLQEKVAKLAASMEEDQKKADENQKAYKKAKDELDAAIAAKDATIADLQAKLKDAELTPARLDAAVKDRAELIGKAKAIFGDKLTVDGQTDSQIRRQVVNAKLGDTAKDYTDEQVAVAFNTLAATTDGTKQLGSAIRDAAPAHKPGFADSGEHPDKTKAYDEYEHRLTSAWRTPNPAAAQY
jgi:hypothetical protein